MSKSNHDEEVKKISKNKTDDSKTSKTSLKKNSELKEKQLKKKSSESGKKTIKKKNSEKNELIVENKNLDIITNDVKDFKQEDISLNDDNKININDNMDEKKIESKSLKITIEKNFRIIDVVIISVIMLSIGLFVGSLFLKEKKKTTVYTTDNEYLNEFLSVVDTIKNNAYEQVSDEQLFTSAVEGMLHGIGDAYSDYFNTTETTNFEIRMEGSYVGAGCEIATFVDTPGVIVISVYDDSPALRAGLQSGDKIVEIDGVNVLDWSSDKVSEYIRKNGAIGTNINLTIERNGENIKINLVRGQVVLKTVSGNVINKNGKNIGYIKIDLFASNTYEQFNNVLKELEKSKIDSLIIDVRDNNGGYLNIASSIISKFLPSNKVIYQLQDSRGTQKVYSLTPEKRNYDIVVLVNEASASASEILASSLMESYGATVIGRTTYGKGTVQETSKLSNGNLIKYTIQKWLTPNGKLIDNVGITPNEIVNDDSVMIDRAVEILLNK